MNVYLKLACTAGLLATASWIWFEAVTATPAWWSQRPVHAGIAALGVVVFGAAAFVLTILWVWFS